MTRLFSTAVARCDQVADRLSGIGWIPLFVLRVSIGFMFFSGAVGKLGDLAHFVAMFDRLGIPAPALAAPTVAVVELVGGAALMLGLVIRPVSLVLALNMIGALCTDIVPDLARRFHTAWSLLSNVFYASEWLLIGVLAYLVCTGAGPVSLDAAIRRRWSSGRRAGRP